jgi:hypothetical protein
MNIFILDEDISTNVKYYCDEHLVKMILEHAQMLSTACRLNGIDEGYKMTHKNHPCTKWVRESLDNWLYLKELTRAMNEELKYRRGYEKNHKSWGVIEKLPVPDLPRIGRTPFAQCMPDEYKHEDVAQAYRTFYLKEKVEFATWKWKRQKPEWV